MTPLPEKPSEAPGSGSSGSRRVPADEIVYVAVGVPSGVVRAGFTRKALAVLNKAGFAVKELAPEDIVASAAHIVRIQTMAEQAASTDTIDPQEN
ncbi:hypothetical protein NBH00_05065 [Paraconexibacter antarcticus]|uniref:Uncharacterized protein n=1 Tax=Paraconexibacter antarcticus TaxID=2949664 RepID=A0ABY5DY74_9ACTN|nr:hypothetical protein [Paraconexibacter antarcticus]UTI65580.1 hypothetical protein NBH00_05065 [Paraconexibacter antarcticus]